MAGSVRKCFRFTKPKQSRAAVRRRQATNDARGRFGLSSIPSRVVMRLLSRPTYMRRTSHIAGSCAGERLGTDDCEATSRTAAYIELGQRTLAGRRAGVHAEISFAREDR